MYGGYITVKTETSHPAEVAKKKTVSACAVGAQILFMTGFESSAHPFGNHNVVLHSFFNSCGIDEGKKTDFGVPIATPKFNTIAPFWTASWQMRNLEGTENAAAMAASLKRTVEQICAAAEKGRTPVKCEITGTDKPGLIGYQVAEDHPTTRLLKRGFETTGSRKVEIKADQFGGFNGNFIFTRFGKEMLIAGTGADQIHTNEETVSIKGMTRVAQGVLGAMLDSYRYHRAGN